jgi:hypothetical protein
MGDAEVVTDQGQAIRLTPPQPCVPDGTRPDQAVGSKFQDPRGMAQA